MQLKMPDGREVTQGGYQDPDWGPIDHPKRALQLANVTEARKLVLP